MGGVELIRRARAFDPDLICVIVTGYQILALKNQLPLGSRSKGSWDNE